MFARLVKLTLFAMLAFSAMAETLTVPVQNGRWPMRIAREYTWQSNNFRYFTYLDKNGKDLKLTNPGGTVTYKQWEMLKKNTKVAAVVIPSMYLKTSLLSLRNQTLSSKCADLGLGKADCRSIASHNRIRTNRVLTADIRILTSMIPVPPDTESPTAPTALKSTALPKKGDYRLTWTASTDNIGVTRYLVYRFDTALNFTEGTSFVVSGLAQGTNYKFSVTAWDAYGNESERSGEIIIEYHNSPPPTHWIIDSIQHPIFLFLAIILAILAFKARDRIKLPQLPAIIARPRQIEFRVIRVWQGIRLRPSLPKLAEFTGLNYWHGVRQLLHRKEPEPKPIVVELTSNERELLFGLPDEFLGQLASVLSSSGRWESHFFAAWKVRPEFGLTIVKVWPRLESFPNLQAHRNNVEQVEKIFIARYRNVEITHEESSKLFREGLGLKRKSGVKFELQLKSSSREIKQ